MQFSRRCCVTGTVNSVHALAVQSPTTCLVTVVTASDLSIHLTSGRSSPPFHWHDDSPQGQRQSERYTITHLGLEPLGWEILFNYCSRSLATCPWVCATSTEMRPIRRIPSNHSKKLSRDNRIRLVRRMQLVKPEEGIQGIWLRRADGVILRVTVVEKARSIGW